MLDDPDFYQIPADELRGRLKKYLLQPGEVLEDVFGANAIFDVAGIDNGSGYYFLHGKINLGKSRLQRLARAVIMAETGMIRKQGGKIVIGKPTRPMPPNHSIKITNTGPVLVRKQNVPTSVTTMPSFKQVFGR